jgi:hypothetical protein
MQSGQDDLSAANGELRSALIRGIARRVGKSVDHISTEEACSAIPLAELYHRRLRRSTPSSVIERFLSTFWWR